MAEPDPSCTECSDNEDTWEERLASGEPGPTRWWHCSCGEHLERWRGQGEVSCDCGAEYNSSGQLLRSDWRSNPAWADDEIDDLTGFEISQLREEGSL